MPQLALLLGSQLTLYVSKKSKYSAGNLHDRSDVALLCRDFLSAYVCEIWRDHRRADKNVILTVYGNVSIRIQAPNFDVLVAFIYVVIQNSRTGIILKYMYVFSLTKLLSPQERYTPRPSPSSLATQAISGDRAKCEDFHNILYFSILLFLIS
jgi:hypothetical protein